jgi:hypothetical protein
MAVALIVAFCCTPLLCNQWGSASVGDPVSGLKDLAGSIEALITAIGIVVGGVWAYLLFVRKRQKYQRAKVEQSLFHRLVSPQHRLLRVTARISNAGDVLLSLVSCESRVQQLMPVTDELLKMIGSNLDPVPKGEAEVEWPLLGSREIHWGPKETEVEPGEYEEFQSDFFVGADVRTVEIYSYFKNVSKKDREIGWSCSAAFDIDPKIEGRKGIGSTQEAEKAQT